jgi:hypothetical protein
VLGHNGSRDALHVGEQDAALGDCRDRDAALDAGAHGLNPADPRAIRQQFRGTKADTASARAAAETAAALSGQ